MVYEICCRCRESDAPLMRVVKVLMEGLCRFQGEQACRVRTNMVPSKSFLKFAQCSNGGTGSESGRPKK